MLPQLIMETCVIEEFKLSNCGNFNTVRVSFSSLTRYLRCCGDGLVECDVTGYVMENGESNFKGTHEHGTVEELIALDNFKDQLWLAVKTNEDTQLRVIYDNIAKE